MEWNLERDFAQLYTRDGLLALDRAFVLRLAEADAALYRRMLAGRAEPDMLSDKEHSELIIDAGPHLEDFIAELFSIRAPLAELKQAHSALAPLYSCKRLFVQRRAAKSVKPEAAELMVEADLLAALAQAGMSLPTVYSQAEFEMIFARSVMGWMDAAESHADALDAAARYAGWALHATAGQARHAHGTLFKLPRKTSPHELLALETIERDGVAMLALPARHRRNRQGFDLTDAGVTLAQALDEANYCIWCHNQGKDSCSKGLHEKDTSFRTSALDIQLAGCPLEEKISEMHALKASGIPIGALAAIVIDNPMCAGTGHRICNDCMKSCIYQKQEPVNIPAAESRTLKDVLELPYGFEIYSLLTRWNPLNLRRPVPKPESGRHVLVAGMGPAGYTLAHHLMNDGHTVVGIDGLKIEPLPESLSGVAADGSRVTFHPIRDIADIREKLDERTLAGFGGVAEYGITVRWDKNFLKIIRLLLERREQFALLGGVRFGSAITPDTAFALGFDHVALCLGAGKPTILDIPGGLARGVRTASDFLMALQLTGAAKADSIANLQLRLPIVVIGGGLTAIDTATESLAYYPVQVEKFLSRYETLTRERGEAAVRRGWEREECDIADEFVAHAKALRAERAKPNPDVAGLLERWGGATLVYRKRLIDAPSYRLNHEEVEKALEENIFIAPQLEPLRIDTDANGHAASITFRHTGPQADGEDGTVTLAARSILIAAGTSPNTVLAQEFPDSIALHGRYFRAVDENGHPVQPQRSAKPARAQVLMAMEPDGRAMSFFGDLHPSFAGNVVKAMGSAKQGYPVVSRALARRPAHAMPRAEFLSYINDCLRARVHQVIRLTPTIIEIIIRAPLAASAFRPGQFYRLQNYEANALVVASDKWQVATTLAMEGLAMTGAWVDKEGGLVSVIALEMGGSSDLCAYLRPGEPVVLMGPTGTPTEIVERETVILAGGGLGNAVLFSIGTAMRAAGSTVLYFAGYRQARDRYKTAEIEQAADLVVWCCDEPDAFAPARPQDRAFHGTIVQAMEAYAMGELGPVSIPMDKASRLIVIGSDRMMAATGIARHTSLKPYLRPDLHAIGSINSPMQCMMKEICGQCIQQHVDPASGAVSYVYSCLNQDQALDHVSFPFLRERLRQNSLQERLTAQWIDRCLSHPGLRQTAA